MDSQVLNQLRSLLGEGQAVAPMPEPASAAPLDFSSRAIRPDGKPPQSRRTAKVQVPETQESTVPTPRKRPELAKPLDFSDRAIVPGSDYTGVERFGQNALEIAKGVPAGAGGLFGSALKGLPALDSHRTMLAEAPELAERMASIPDMSDEEFGALIEEGNKLPMMAAVGFRNTASLLRSGKMTPEQYRKSIEGRGPITDAPAVKAGNWITDNADVFPAAPGFEDSVGRNIGQGLGSVAAGVGTTLATGGMGGAALGSLASAGVFGLSGSGEALQRAIDDGATEEQILEAARLGAIPGLTDQIPIEVLLKSGISPGKWPILAIAAAKVGKQALTEGLQEGAQEFLQNLIAREVYNPDQSLTEGLPGSAGYGSATGAFVEAGNQVARMFAGRKGRHSGTSAQPDDATPDPESVKLLPPPEGTPEPDQAETAMPSPDLQTPAAAETPPVRAEGEQEGAAGVEPEPEAQGPTIADLDTREVALLTAGGYDVDDILDMAPEERTSEAADLEASGVKPDFRALSNEAKGAGTRTDPAQVSTAADIERASSQTNQQPTNAQKEAGNYAKGHIKLQGMDIAIENPKGSERSGKDPDGQDWSVTLPGAYGYIKRTEGADGDQVDVFIGDNPESDFVLVVDQIDPSTGKFDEHKAILGTNNADEAIQLYKDSYSDDADARIGGTREIPVAEFKTWARTGDTSKPFATPAPAAEPETETIPDEQSKAFDQYVQDIGAGNLIAKKIAETLGVDERIAGQLLSQAAARGSVRLDNATGRYRRKPTQTSDLTLMQALASNGGIQNEGGELSAIGIADRLVPGRGRLVRKSGMTLDQAREFAVEAGYLRDNSISDGGRSDSTVRDLLDALDGEARGNKQITETDRNDDTTQYDREEDERYVEREVDKIADEYGLNLRPETVDLATKLIIDDGLTVEDAIERAEITLSQDVDGDSVENEIETDYDSDNGSEDNASVQPERTSDSRESVRSARPDGDGPGQEAEDEGRSEISPGSGTDGRPDEGQGRDETNLSEPAQGTDSDRVAAESESAPTPDDTPTTEIGADNKPQTVIPGAEQISDKDLSERIGRAPLKAKVEQKDAGGLFGDDRNEVDLFADSKPDTKPVADEPVEGPKETRPEPDDSDTSLSINVTDPFKLSPLAETDAARIQDEVTRIIRDVAGPNVDILTPQSLQSFGTNTDAVRRSGGEPGQQPTGAYQSPLDPSVRPIIHIAMSLGNDPRVTSAHESWHHLEFSGLITPREMAIMMREDERLRAYVAKNVFKSDKSDPKIAGMPTYEVRAYAFQEYFRRRLEGEPDSGTHIGVRKIFSFLYDMFRRIRSALAGMGYRTTEDVFQSALRGDMRSRTPSGRRRINEGGDLAFATHAGRTRTRANYTMPGEDPALPNWLLGNALNKFLPGRESVITKVQDRFYEIHRLQREVKKSLGIKDVPEHLDTYMAESLYYGRAGERLNSLRERYVEPLAQLMKERGVSMEDLNDYLYARHAPERNAAIAAINPDMPDGGSGMTTAAAQALEARLIQQGNASAMVEAARIVDALTSRARATLKSAGLISQETYDEWSNKYQFYVPLRGFENDPGTQMERPMTGRGFDVRGSETKQAMGRRSKAEQPLLFVVQQAEQAIIRAEKNRVGKTFLRFLNRHRNTDLFEVTKGEKKRRANPTTGMVEEYWSQPAFSNDENLFAVKLGGKVTWIKINHPGIARAMRRLGSENLGTLGAAMAKITRYLAMINTSLNPEFVVSNMARDLQTALVNISETEQAGIRKEIVKAIPKAMTGVYRGTSGKRDTYWSKRYGEFADNGGKISFHSMQNIDTIRSNLESAFKDQSKLRKGLRGTLDWIDKANGAVENALRLATYDALIKRGYTVSKAASVARELTVNFNRKGEWGAVVNSMYLFFNAALQGNVRMGMALYRSPTARKIAVGMVGAGVAMEFINHMIAGDDDDGENFYDKIPQWEKERNFILMIPGSTEGEYLKIPLAYGYNVFMVLGQQIGSVGRGQTKPLDGAFNYMSATLNAFMPIGMGASPLQTVTPTIARPFVEIAENKSWFGGPIYPTEYPNSYQPRSSSAFQSISPAYKWMAEGLNKITGGNAAKSGVVDMSPEVIEHMMNFATGGAGTFWLDRLPNTVAGIVTGEPWLPEKTPFVRRTFGKKSEYVDRGTYYDMRDKVMALRYEIKEFTEDGNAQAAKKARERDPALTKVIGRFEATEKAIRRINKDKRAVTEAKNIPPEQRKRRVEQLDKRKLDVMREARKAYYEAKK